MNSAPRPPVVCLVPVRNEAWILPTFLTAVSLWADLIVLADQGSTDGSAEIARRFPKVTLVPNPSGAFDEAERQQLLLAAAREREPRAILVALDADEFPSPLMIDATWFARLAEAGAGAHGVVPLFNMKPGLRQGWVGYADFVAAWVDTGRGHTAEKIHSRRLPVVKNDPVIAAPAGAVLMHWQYVAPARMRSKHRWYVVWERLHRPKRSAVEIYRQYHHMDAIKPRELLRVDPEWLEWYLRQGVDLAAIVDDGRHWWNGEVLQWLDRYGARHFAREDIWAHDWYAEAAVAGYENPGRFSDPRTPQAKLIHWWLRQTQGFHRFIVFRAVDKACAMFF